MSKELLDSEELKQKGLTHLAELLESTDEEDAVADEEAQEETTDEVQESELDAVLSTLELDESVKTKMKDIFSTAVTTRAQELSESKLADLDTKVETKLAEQQEEQDKHIANYLDFVVEGWVKEHKDTIVNEAKVEIASSFLGELKSLFEKHQIVLESDEQFDAIAEAKAEVKAAKEELQEALVMLKEERLESFAKDVKSVMAKLSEGMTDVQKDRFNSLVGELDVELEEGIESVEERMTQIKDVFVSASNTESKDDDVKESEEQKPEVSLEEEVLEEEAKPEDDVKEAPVVDEKMAKYLSAIKKSFR